MHYLISGIMPFYWRFLISLPAGGSIRNDNSTIFKDGKQRRFAVANRLCFPFHFQIAPVIPRVSEESSGISFNLYSHILLNET